MRQTREQLAAKILKMLEVGFANLAEQQTFQAGHALAIVHAHLAQKPMRFPATARAAIVTVGGLCPGLNDIIRALVQALESYGLPAGHILGIRYGFRGFYHAEDPPIVLTSTRVDSIHLAGGTILGTSRGGSDIPRIVDAIAAMQLSFVFVVGGNGGNAAAEAIHAACMERDLACAVVGLPKSIDNDILLIDSCFGFATAVSEAVRAILAANVEARSMHHGVGLVKLMGRSSGFIAAQASIASGEVDVCIIPEAPFVLERVLAYIYERLRTRGHCTVVVAEGAAQEAMRAELVADGGKLPAETDPSGNPVLLDVGRWLKDKIKAAAIKPEDAGVNGAGAIVPDIKYISPAYSVLLPCCDAWRCRCVLTRRCVCCLPSCTPCAP